MQKSSNPGVRLRIFVLVVRFGLPNRDEQWTVELLVYQLYPHPPLRQTHKRVTLDLAVSSVGATIQRERSRGHVHRDYAPIRDDCQIDYNSDYSRYDTCLP